MYDGNGQWFFINPLVATQNLWTQALLSHLFVKGGCFPKKLAPWRRNQRKWAKNPQIGLYPKSEVRCDLLARCDKTCTNLGGQDWCASDRRSSIISGLQHAHRIKFVGRARERNHGFLKVLRVSQRHTSGPKAGKFQTAFRSPDMRMCLLCPILG
jgi:hypothetical protein